MLWKHTLLKVPQEKVEGILQYIFHTSVSDFTNINFESKFNMN